MAKILYSNNVSTFLFYKKKKKKKNGETLLTSLNFRDFCRHFSNFQKLLFWCIEFLFCFKYHLLPLNIVVKLNRKLRKMVKGILIILYIYVKFNQKSKKKRSKENQSR
jgi:hypothetical protein